RFTAATIARLLEHIQMLLTHIASDLQQRLIDLPTLTTAEQQQIVAWNSTFAAYPQDRCVHQLVEAQVAQTPDAVAVIFADTHLTYQDLNRRANHLAHYLRSLGVGPEVQVGICLERSLEVTVAVLGVLKAGGVCVPLDPAYPRQRLSFMIRDS